MNKNKNRPAKTRILADYFQPSEAIFRLRSNLCRERQVLRTYVVASEERHAAENAIVVVDQFVEILVASLIARIETETSYFVQSGRADEIVAHARRVATGDAAAAFDAAVKLVDFFARAGSIFSSNRCRSASWFSNAPMPRDARS